MTYKTKAQNLDRLVQIESQSKFKEIIHLTRHENFGLHVNSLIPVTYKQTGSLISFHESTAMFKLILGPFGSGKSSACCAEIIHCACNMPVMVDGVRRSRWAIIRNTLGELESTTMVTWLQWFGRLGVVKRTKKPLLSYNYAFNDSGGKVELELIFIGLDSEDDKEKLESLELTCAYVNEMQHVPKGIVTHLMGRIGRFPKRDQMHDEKYYSAIIADTNPPDEDHWIYADFEKNKIDDAVVFHQPPGLIQDVNGQWMDNPCADNIQNLKPKYYYNMAMLNRFSEEYVKVYCRGEYGIVIPGKKVFHEYNDDLHSQHEVPILFGKPIIVAWDYGLTPACLFMQISDAGQLRCFKEFVTERSGVRQLARDMVMPYIRAELEGYEVISIGDPSGKTPKDTDELSCQDILKQEGLETNQAKTNVINQRLESIRFFLTKLVGNGEPGLIISRKDCPTLRKSFIGKYCYKRLRVIGDEKYHEIPDKSHPWSDIMDCAQYGACEFGGEGLRFTQSTTDYSDFMNTEKF